MNKDLVYVCSPLGAPTEDGINRNMQKASEYVKNISERCNCRAIAPHSFLPKYLDDSVPAERELGLKFGLDLIKLCKKMYVCGDVISNGMRKEIELARSLDIPIVRWGAESKSRVTITVIEIEGESLDMYI